MHKNDYTREAMLAAQRHMSEQEKDQRVDDRRMAVSIHRVEQSLDVRMCEALERIADSLEDMQNNLRDIREKMR